MAFFLPTLCKKRVSEITPPLLRKMGIRGILLDVDNTLSTHGSQQPLPAALSWTRELSGLGIKLMIISNNHKERVEPFAAQFSLPFLYDAKKPMSKGFSKASEELGIPKEELLVVGDKIFTDILGANLSGIRSVLVEPIELEKGFFFRVKRWMERPFLHRMEKRLPRG